MFRSMSVFAVAAGLFVTGATASTVGFHGTADATITLRSATFAGTSTDALSEITVFEAGFPSEEAVEFEFSAHVQADADFFDHTQRFGSSAAAQGVGASDPAGPDQDAATAAAFVDRNFFYGSLSSTPTGPDIELVFDYEVTTTATTTGDADAMVEGSVQFGVTDDFFDTNFTDELALRRAGNFAGSLSFVIAPGTGVSASTFTGASGVAVAPAPIPLPAGLPLAASGLLLLGAMGHRRRRSASA